MIEHILEDYKNITEKVIKLISNDDEVIQLMEEREKLIKNLFSNGETVEDIKRIYLNKGLLQLDKELEIAIENEKVKVKEEIKKIHKQKNAKNAYDRNRPINNFFSTKI